MKKKKELNELIVMIRGAGEMASAVAHRLFRARFKTFMLEIPHPLAVRREVSFCEAVFDGEKEVEGVRAIYVNGPEEIPAVWKKGGIPVLVDPEGRETRAFLKPDILIDAILAKRNVGTRIDDASLVIGLGPGFIAGEDVNVVVETNRGHNLGKVIVVGAAEPDTGIPGDIGGFTAERVLRATNAGVFKAHYSIGDVVDKGVVVARVDDSPVIAEITGRIRGLLRAGVNVEKGTKVGDIDPRGKKEHCFTISDKARAIAGAVLEAILHRFN